MIGIFKKNPHFGKKKTKFEFKIFVKDIKIAKNDYFMKNSTFTLFLKDDKDQTISRKITFYTVQESSQVVVNDCLTFIGTLFHENSPVSRNSSIDRTSDVATEDTSRYLEKDRHLVLRQTFVLKNEGLVHHDIGIYELSLDKIISDVHIKEYYFDIIDEHVNIRISAEIYVKALAYTNSSSNLNLHTSMDVFDSSPRGRDRKYKSVKSSINLTTAGNYAINSSTAYSDSLEHTDGKLDVHFLTDKDLIVSHSSSLDVDIDGDDVFQPEVLLNRIANKFNSMIKANTDEFKESSSRPSSIGNNALIQDRDVSEDITEIAEPKENHLRGNLSDVSSVSNSKSNFQATVIVDRNSPRTKSIFFATDDFDCPRATRQVSNASSLPSQLNSSHSEEPDIFRNVNSISDDTGGNVSQSNSNTTTPRNGMIFHLQNLFSRNNNSPRNSIANNSTVTSNSNSHKHLKPLNHNQKLKEKIGEKEEHLKTVIQRIAFEKDMISKDNTVKTSQLNHFIADLKALKGEIYFLKTQISHIYSNSSQSNTANRSNDENLRQKYERIRKEMFQVEDDLNLFDSPNKLPTSYTSGTSDSIVKPATIITPYVNLSSSPVYNLLEEVNVANNYLSTSNRSISYFDMSLYSNIDQGIQHINPRSPRSPKFSNSGFFSPPPSLSSSRRHSMSPNGSQLSLTGSNRLNSLDAASSIALKRIKSTLKESNRRQSIQNLRKLSKDGHLSSDDIMLYPLVNIAVELPPNLNDWQFDVMEISDGLKLCNIIGKLFETLIDLDAIKIDPSTLARYIMEVAKNYHDRPFHNLQHATCVAHFTYMLIKETKASESVPQHQLFGMLLAATVHDVDHPGNTNLFEINSGSELAIRYNDQSVLENHHCSTAFRLMSKRKMGVLNTMEKQHATEVRRMIISCVMATDIAVHFDLIEQIRISAVEGLDLNDVKNQEQLGKILVHGADLSNPVRPFHIARKWAERVSIEFNTQVAKEQELGMPVLGFMLTPDEKAFCKNETGFASFVVAPMWRNIALFFPQLQFLVDQLDSNLLSYKMILDKLNVSNSRSQSNNDIDIMDTIPSSENSSGKQSVDDRTETETETEQNIIIETGKKNSHLQIRRLLADEEEDQLSTELFHSASSVDI